MAPRFCPSHRSRLALPFFFNDTATTEIYTLSLHDALPISSSSRRRTPPRPSFVPAPSAIRGSATSLRASTARRHRSEEHTSELQSHLNLVCRLLLEKKNTKHRVQHVCGPPLSRGVLRLTSR